MPSEIDLVLSRTRAMVKATAMLLTLAVIMCGLAWRAGGLYGDGLVLAAIMTGIPCLVGLGAFLLHLWAPPPSGPVGDATRAWMRTLGGRDVALVAATGALDACVFYGVTGQGVAQGVAGALGILFLGLFIIWVFLYRDARRIIDDACARLRGG